MTRDEAIKYNDLYQEVELAISNIDGLGFDVKEFKNALKEIHNAVNDNVKYKYVKGMAEASYIQSYSNGISELNKLKNKLDNYDIYMKAQNGCNFINMKLNNNISADELDKLVSKMIYTLKSINKSKTIDYDNEKHIVEKIYETAYNVIKLEVIIKADSQLFLYVKNEDMNISYFNNLILKDIEKIDLKDEENNAIKIKMYELGEKGIYSNYLNLELIKLILMTEKDVDLQKVVLDKLDILATDIKQSTNEAFNNYRMADAKDDEKKIAFINFNGAQKLLKNKIISTILAFSIFISGGFMVHKLGREVAKDKYIEETTNYSSNSNTYDSKKDGMHLDNVPDDSVIARVSNNTLDNKTEVLEYDLSDINLETVYDYDKYVRENYDTEGKNVEIQVTKYTKDACVGEEILLYLVYVCILLTFETISYNPFNHDSIISLKYIKELLEKLRDNQANVDGISKELAGYVDKLMEEIDKNDELRNRFNQLYEENKFLLDNPQELYERVNNLDDLGKMERAKKLVKEKK